MLDMAGHPVEAGMSSRTVATFRHAGSLHLYEAIAPNRLRVSDEQAGLVGTFTARGEWLEGDLRQADPFLCGWLDHKSREEGYRNPLAGA